MEVQLNPDLAKLLLPWELSSEEILKAERLKLDTLHRVIEDCIFLLLDSDGSKVGNKTSRRRNIKPSSVLCMCWTTASNLCGRGFCMRLIDRSIRTVMSSS